VNSGLPAAPIPAATVVLLRPGPDGGLPELLLTHRPITMAFAADLHVFPGGRVDPGDADPRAIRRSVVTPGEAAERLGGGVPATTAVAAHLAAIRELFEEAGVACGRAGRLAAGYIGTRPAAARRRPSPTRGRFDSDFEQTCWRRSAMDNAAIMPRLDTRFFAAELPAGAEPTFGSTGSASLVDGARLRRWPPARSRCGSRRSTLQQLERRGRRRSAG
jgi:8-oxo-dGTP pyrophosphatase MutT (NUDIX family)